MGVITDVLNIAIILKILNLYSMLSCNNIAINVTYSQCSNILSFGITRLRLSLERIENRLYILKRDSNLGLTVCLSLNLKHDNRLYPTTIFSVLRYRPLGYGTRLSYNLIWTKITFWNLATSFIETNVLTGPMKDFSGFFICLLNFKCLFTSAFF